MTDFLVFLVVYLHTVFMSATAHIICTTLWRVETVQSDAFVLDLSLSGLSTVFITGRNEVGPR